MDGTWFAEFAPIYEAFAARGISKRDADDYELWEVAAAFGGHRPDEPDPGTDPADPYANFDWEAEAVASRKEGREPRIPRPPRR